MIANVAERAGQVKTRVLQTESLRIISGLGRTVCGEGVSGERRRKV